ncbi:MAG: hypothetical protein P4N41_15325 [Negativicutes bacterium]|nr:hypothetical protein [Negativicutes bacterium]MDR3591023.1 hypothetical protein [Negativicutes bacterium]
MARKCTENGLDPSRQMIVAGAARPWGGGWGYHPYHPWHPWHPWGWGGGWGYHHWRDPDESDW